jgi:hypothetical protein
MNDYEMEQQVRRAIQAEFKGWTIDHLEKTWRQRQWSVHITNGLVHAIVYYIDADQFPWSVDGLRAETLSAARARRVARLREHLETMEGTR